MSIEPSPLPPTNQQSTVSLSFGILTLLTVCMGMVPIPFTGFVCFPAGILSALIALISGVMSLSQIRRHGERGRGLAWTGIIIGGLTLIASLCVLLVIAGLFFWHLKLLPIQLPGNYQI